ncbi:MFS transporter, LAT3 family, solute carrier family 43, member 3, partial [Paragonimus westermani]
MFWFSGVHYGYNALLPALKELGVFSSYCRGNDCSGQDKMFSYAFIVSVIVQMCLIPLAGFLMDKVGLRINKLVSVSVVSIGLFMFAFTNSSTGPILFVAMALVSYASLASLICNHQISSQFPRARGVVIALISGAYDSSTAVFFIFAQTYPKISLQTSFIILAVGTLIFGVIMALFFLTQYSEDMTYCDRKSRDDEVEVLEVDGGIISQSEKEALSSDGETQDIDAQVTQILDKKYPNLKSCFRSWPFFFVAFWFALGLLRFSYFFSQLSKQLEVAFPGQRDIVDNLLRISSAISMCGFLVAPISGTIMELSKRAYQKQMKLRLANRSGYPVNENELYWTHLRAMAPATTIMSTAALILSSVLFVQQQQFVFYVAFVCHMFLRSLLFSTTATMVIIAFPVRNYGIVYGVANFIAGVMSTIQYGLLEMPVVAGNAICVVISVLMFI